LFACVAVECKQLSFLGDLHAVYKSDSAIAKGSIPQDSKIDRTYPTFQSIIFDFVILLVIYQYLQVKNTLYLMDLFLE
jgi:hypothetical protein